MRKPHTHIGSLIKATLLEKGIAASWLAKKIHCHKTNMYKIFKKEYIDPQLLEDISIALDTDFFVYHSNYVNEKRVAKPANNSSHYG